MTRSKSFASVVSVLIAGVVGFAAPASYAQDYRVVASGPLVSVTSDSRTFNGTTVGTLPRLLDDARLAGGSFRAIYAFSQVTPTAGTEAFYELSAPSGMTSYELLDSSGAVVHRGTNPSEPVAILANNNGGAPFIVDQVVLGSRVNNVTGLRVPAPLYGATPDFNSFADFNFAGYVSGGVNYLTDLRIPTDAATYLAFPGPPLPNRMFNVVIEFGDGDYLDRVAPYQYVTTQLQYDITALTVTAVPEPGMAGLVIVPLCVLGMRRVGKARRNAGNRAASLSDGNGPSFSPKTWRAHRTGSGRNRARAMKCHAVPDATRISGTKPGSLSA